MSFKKIKIKRVFYHVPVTDKALFADHRIGFPTKEIQKDNHAVARSIHRELRLTARQNNIIAPCKSRLTDTVFRRFKYILKTRFTGNQTLFYNTHMNTDILMFRYKYCLIWN